MNDTHKQLVFIDDSGDPGFKVGFGSTKYFVVSCVIFNDSDVAKETDFAMRQTKKELGLGDDYEYKFNGTKKKYVKEVLEAIKRFDFRVRAICMEKALIYSTELRNNNKSFYNYAISRVLRRSPNLLNANVKLDGHSDKAYMRATKSYLRKEVNKTSHKISKINFKDSKNDTLIQLADLVAGSVHRSLKEDKTDCRDYLDILEKAGKIEDIWRFR